MLAPDNYETLSDDELLTKLIKMYRGDKNTAKYVFDVLRGKVTPIFPMK